MGGIRNDFYTLARISVVEGGSFCLLISSFATLHFVSETKGHVKNKNYFVVTGNGGCAGAWRRQLKGKGTGVE